MSDTPEAPPAPMNVSASGFLEAVAELPDCPIYMAVQFTSIAADLKVALYGPKGSMSQKRAIQRLKGKA